MTIKEYDEWIEKWLDNVKDEDYDDINWDEFFDFQYNFMAPLLEDYKARADTEVKKIVSDIMEENIMISTSGNVCQHIKDEDTANQVEDELWDKFGEYLLESYIYPANKNEDYILDVMFAGNYTPGWEGFEEDW